jgi:hypothetical protein
MYEFNFIKCSEYNFVNKLEKATELGWELAGNINPYRGRGSGGEQTYFTIPLKRKKER